MALNFHKPYVWLDSNLNLYIKMWSERGLQISKDDGYFDSYTDYETLRIIFKLYSGEYSESSFELDLFSAGYDANVHRKVAVIIIDESDNIVGSHTIIPDPANFSSLPANTPEFIPYMWLGFRTTDESTVHIAVLLPDTASVDSGDIDNQVESFYRNVNYVVKSGEALTSMIYDLEHQLDSSNNFDPVMENIHITFVEYEDDGVTEKKKGTGTVHTSEGDASTDG